MLRRQRKMRPAATSKLPSFVAAAALAAAVGAVFWVPAATASRGFFPAPLDDVYIHFDFARSLAQGHPFEWLPGNGYSSGETSPLYAVVLALGWLVGFRGRLLGVWAAIVAVLAVASFVRSAQTLARPRSRWLAAGIALLVLSMGVVDWSLFSGMEVATFAAALGRALVASLARARGSTSAVASRAKPRNGASERGAPCSCSCVRRPACSSACSRSSQREARRVAPGSRPCFGARSPGLVATALVLGANRLATGEAQSAGAQLKLLSSNPYLSDVDRARAYVENLVTFAIKGVRAELVAVRTLGLVVPGLAMRVAPAARETARRCCVLARRARVGAARVVQQQRPVPQLSLLRACAAARARRRGLRSSRDRASDSGGGVDARRRRRDRSGDHRRGCADSRPGRAFRSRGGEHPRSADRGRHAPRRDDGARRQRPRSATPARSRSSPVARARCARSRRIRKNAIRACGRERRGSDRGAHRAPPGDERPRYLALYPNWFGLLTSRFGVELERVTLTDNLICAGPTKVIYRSDWSALDSPHAPSPEIIDELDVADVISEAEHAYVTPAPNGGWTTLDILADDTGARRFDGGRTIPAGETESFVVRQGASARQVRIVVRVDDETRGLRVRTPHGMNDLVVAPARPGARAWREASATVDAPAVGEHGRARGDDGPVPRLPRVDQALTGGGSDGDGLEREAGARTARAWSAERTRREPNRGCASVGRSQTRQSPTSSSRAATIELRRSDAHDLGGALALGGRSAVDPRTQLEPSRRVRPDAGNQSRGAARRRPRRAGCSLPCRARPPPSARRRRPGSSANKRYCSRVRACRCRPLRPRPQARRPRARARARRSLAKEEVSRRRSLEPATLARIWPLARFVLPLDAPL